MSKKLHQINANDELLLNEDDLRYDMSEMSGGGAMADRTTNAVIVTNSPVNVSFPDAVAGKMRDFLIYVNATGYATGGQLTVTLPTGAKHYGDDFPSVTETGEYLVAVTEFAANRFYVRTIVLDEVVS